MKSEILRPTDIPYWGLDSSLESRPGVPQEAPPHLLPGTHWIEPARQPVEGPVLTRAGLTRPTPVFSTALPPRGVSGALRRLAYRIPDHRIPHWALVILADRVDVVESRVSGRKGRALGTEGPERDVLAGSPYVIA